jgi:2-dehydro-3-deoxygluconokinase
VGLNHVVHTENGRFGLYFVETGASQRGGLVIYDREGSSFALAGAAAYPWPSILAGAGWLHTSGVTAGVSRPAADAMAAAVKHARTVGVSVSCDLNFRRKLWRWENDLSPEALFERTMAGILPGIDVLIGNPQDLAATIGEVWAAEPPNDEDEYVALAARVAARFPAVRAIAMTLRQNHSASFNRWGALLYSVAESKACYAPVVAGTYAPYQIHNIIDRVGTGDVFAGALIFALQSGELQAPERALAFATAASCLAHTVAGDFFHGTRAEVETLMHGDGAGYVSR